MNIFTAWISRIKGSHVPKFFYFSFLENLCLHWYTGIDGIDVTKVTTDIKSCWCLGPSGINITVNQTQCQQRNYYHEIHSCNKHYYHDKIAILHWLHVHVQRKRWKWKCYITWLKYYVLCNYIHTLYNIQTGELYTRRGSNSYCSFHAGKIKFYS